MLGGAIDVCAEYPVANADRVAVGDDGVPVRKRTPQPDKPGPKSISTDFERNLGPKIGGESPPIEDEVSRTAKPSQNLALDMTWDLDATIAGRDREAAKQPHDEPHIHEHTCPRISSGSVPDVTRRSKTGRSAEATTPEEPRTQRAERQKRGRFRNDVHAPG